MGEERSRALLKLVRWSSSHCVLKGSQGEPGGRLFWIVLGSFELFLIVLGYFENLLGSSGSPGFYEQLYIIFARGSQKYLRFFA